MIKRTGEQITEFVKHGHAALQPGGPGFMDPLDYRPSYAEIEEYVYSGDSAWPFLDHEGMNEVPGQ